MVKEVLLTKEGLENLKKELDELKVVKRKDIAEKIKVARSFGDLSENSEYDEAKNEQAILESRIIAVEKMLQNYKIIDEEKLSTEVVRVGSIIKVYDTKYRETHSYRMVGSNEANPMKDKISDESPLGIALIGRKVGDKINVDTPSGTIIYKLLNIAK